MSTTVQSKLSFGGLAKAFGNLLSFSPNYPVFEPSNETPADMCAAAWKMTGDAMYRTLGQEPPEGNGYWNDETMIALEAYVQNLAAHNVEFRKRIEKLRDIEARYAKMAASPNLHPQQKNHAKSTKARRTTQKNV
ncbi:MAG: hypothetical protein ORO03_02755 [Alphaproteobacteria bacterium]|nr:hypothetical protein [Alphaproteobacteria bacterium]